MRAHRHAPELAARQQHRQVLHGRADAGVIQIHTLRAAAPHALSGVHWVVAWVAVSVQAQQRGIFRWLLSLIVQALVAI